VSDVTVIGLGNMGAALTWAIYGAGHAVTVWNRSPARSKPFSDEAITVARDVASAVEASSVIVVCIDDNRCQRCATR